MNEFERMYALFGCDENVTDEELYSKYLELRTKYQNDRFLEGEAGNEAAEKLTELNSAYAELSEYRKNKKSGGENVSGFETVNEYIKAGKLSEAQAELDKFDERNAEWHYLQSVVFYKKNWANESKKQLEIAIQMDGSVEKYKTAYDKLCKQLNYNEEEKKKKSEYRSGSGTGSTGETSYDEPTDMMGGDSCMEFCCRSMVCSALLNCCCCPSIR